MNLKDDHQYRVLKIFAPSGPIVFKSTDGSTHCSVLRTPAHVVISAPPMVDQSTQTDPRLSTSDDPLAQVILQCCGADAVGLIIKAVPVVWAMFIRSRSPNPSKAVSSSLWDRNYKEGGITTMQIKRNEELLNNIKLKHERFRTTFLF